MLQSKNIKVLNDYSDVKVNVRPNITITYTLYCRSLAATKLYKNNWKNLIRWPSSVNQRDGVD